MAPRTPIVVRRVRAALARAADPARAAGMQAYMKSAMPCRGVPAPAQKALWKAIFPAHPPASVREWQAVALELWRAARFREERYAAIAWTGQPACLGWRTMDAVPMFEEMIVTGAWWDYVDAIATHHLGDVLAAEPARMSRLMRRWARGDDLWKRRSAILCQIRRKERTDLALLYDCIGPSLLAPGRRRARGDLPSEFFIRKAIGWALRQHAWTDPREVARYVRQHRDRLSPLSMREALKNL